MALLRPRLQLRLARLPEDVWEDRGCYPEPDGTDLPARMRFLHPAAAVALMEFEATYPGTIYFSDVYRAPLVSRAAIIRKRKGAQPPGYSGHGWGLSFDVDLRRTLRRWSLEKLRAKLADFGWYGHRMDSDEGHEAHHFNFLGPTPAALGFLGLANPGDTRTWDDPLDARIVALYGDQIHATGELLAVRLEIVGAPSVIDFQREWGLVPDGVPGPRTQRTLAIVTAETRVSEIVL